MNDSLFERLLYEEESTTLDFKKEQYRFVKALEEEKSELLKDILGFANSWRRSEAYILIGVEDVRGGRGIVAGILTTDHLDDHSLQQFVNNLTQRPVRFHYEAFGFEGKQVGIIRVEEQARPLYLKKDYGKLKKNEVYVRRGSSTDPTKPASLDEVAQMGHGSGQQSAELVVEFAEVERDDALGTHISLDAEYCEMPPLESIPDHVFLRPLHPLGIKVMVDPIYLGKRLNKDYLRELSIYEFVRRLFRPVRLVVKNVGQVAANNVRTELTVPTNIGVKLAGPSDFPDAPKQHAKAYADVTLKKIRPAFRREAGEVSIGENGERFRVVIDCGSLQPGRRVWSDVFYIGKRVSGELQVGGEVFAENLPQPKDFNLVVSVNVADRQMTVTELRSLPEPAGDDG